MFDNIDKVYPEISFWVLSNKGIDNEIKLTYDQLVAQFGEERLTKIINNFDPYWLAWKL